VVSRGGRHASWSCCTLSFLFATSPPAPQISRHMRDRTTRLEHETDPALDQLIRILPRTWHPGSVSSLGGQIVLLSEPPRDPAWLTATLTAPPPALPPCASPGKRANKHHPRHRTPRSQRPSFVPSFPSPVPAQHFTASRNATALNSPAAPARVHLTRKLQEIRRLTRASAPLTGHPSPAGAGSRQITGRPPETPDSPQMTRSPAKATYYALARILEGVPFSV
jgi:hypothetical protein